MIPARLSLCTFCVAAALALLAPIASAAYKVTKVTRAGADNLWFWDINNAGLVTGQAANADYSVATGFVYNSHTGVYTDLAGPAGALGSATTGISDTGVVVGEYFTSTSTPGTSFIYEGGSYTDFHVPGATYTFLRGISANARYLAGTYDGFYGFVFDRDTNTLVTVGESMIVQGVNNQGVAAGSVNGSGRTPFLYDFATQVRTDYLPTSDRYRDVNDSGIVTGYGVRDGFDGYVGLVGAPGSTSALKVAGSLNTFGYGINNAGTVVGIYDFADGVNQAFIATTVPEPGAWALMGCGLLGLATLRRREGARS